MRLMVQQNQNKLWFELFFSKLCKTENKHDMFDKEANYEIDCLMRMIATRKDEAETNLSKVKPKYWRLVRKHGIIPDGLVQGKLKSFILKFPNFERDRKRNNDGSTPNLGEGGSGVPNGVTNVD